MDIGIFSDRYHNSTFEIRVRDWERFGWMHQTILAPDGISIVHPPVDSVVVFRLLQVKRLVGCEEFPARIPNYDVAALPVGEWERRLREHGCAHVNSGEFLLFANAYTEIARQVRIIGSCLGVSPCGADELLKVGMERYIVGNRITWGVEIARFASSLRDCALELTDATYILAKPAQPTGAS